MTDPFTIPVGAPVTAADAITMICNSCGAQFRYPFGRCDDKRCPSCGVDWSWTWEEDVTDDPTRPAHYQRGGTETIHYIYDTLGEEGFRDYCIGNVVKYVSRWKDKNGIEDLRKALVYLGWAVDGAPKASE